MMHPRRRSSRGLAEIVGTLMLVVIVVAAATAFAFFVAAYQKQLQAQETFNHNKSLENLRIFGLDPTVGRSQAIINLQIKIASLDVNPIVIQGMTLNGYAIVNYTAIVNGVTSGIQHLNGNPFHSNITYTLTLPAEAQVLLNLCLNASPSNLTSGSYALWAGLLPFSVSSLLSFDTFTSLGNEFIQSFVPPVAIAGLTFVDSYPVLDGTGSYEPATNSTVAVTVDQWAWNVACKVTSNLTGCTGNGSRDLGPHYGQEVELPEPFGTGVSYTIYLNVTNSESLVGSTYITYALP